MRFRNSLRLLMENFQQVYKLLSSKLIINLVASALCCAFVLPELLHLWNHVEVQNLVAQLKEFVKFTSLTSEEIDALKNSIFGKGGALSQVGVLLGSMKLEIALTVVGCAIVYLIKRFAETICHFAVGSTLNDKMATYADTGFFTAFVANLGKASVYSVAYVPMVFAFDLLILVVVWAALTFLPFLTALFVGMTVVALLQAFKLSVTNSWLPAMTTDGKTLSQAMKRGDEAERKQRYKTFSNYLVSVYFIVIVNVMAAIATIGSGLLLTIPASYFFLICMQYVNYYTVKGKKYFLTYEHIATNPDHGDSEHFFDYLSEESENEEENEEKVEE